LADYANATNSGQLNKPAESAMTKLITIYSLLIYLFYLNINLFQKLKRIRSAKPTQREKR
jgi:hypothetical protein